MAAALASYVTGVEEGSLSHDGNETLVAHVGHAYRKELLKRDENDKPCWLIRKERPDSPQKIDAAMASVLSWEARNDAIAAGVTEQPVFSDAKGERIPFDKLVRQKSQETPSGSFLDAIKPKGD